ncbi:nucleotide-diphosphate-sugar epimerase [Streptomyces omiyaensis]|uniref:NmrA family NAD(P)-binding protein n=1 Tax=Streptomyces omiyaensis TaxID=68247 RepID=UPI001676FA5C|nr:NAD(P)H-binding protein [Streptomyces omiyaensis]GGY73282.1 nucleotide-diphosphate-sugar epimerase [Streptomyces omiyaensis]
MTILVTGGTGRLGRHIVERLLLTGQTVRALTRDAGVARLPTGVEVVEGDLEQPSSLAAALDGVGAVHLLGTTGADHAPLRTGGEILTMAAEAGVRRITVLSPGDGQELDGAVRGSGLEWTFLWPVDLMANALGWAETIRTEGRVREPYADRRTASVHEVDVADVVSAILTDGGHAGHRYVLTGPQALSPADKTAALAAATGREIHFTHLTDGQARELWRAQGWPEEGIDFMLRMWATVPTTVADVTSSVERVTGRPPRSFAQWATAHAETFQSRGSE